MGYVIEGLVLVFGLFDNFFLSFAVGVFVGVDESPTLEQIYIHNV